MKDPEITRLPRARRRRPHELCPAPQSAPSTRTAAPTTSPPSWCASKPEGRGLRPWPARARPRPHPRLLSPPRTGGSPWSTSLYALHDAAGARRPPRGAPRSGCPPRGSRCASRRQRSLTLGDRGGQTSDALGRWGLHRVATRCGAGVGALVLSALSDFFEDALRRPGFVALSRSASVALAAYLRAGEAPPEPPRMAGAPTRRCSPLMALHAAAFTYLAVERDRGLWSATVDLGIFKGSPLAHAHGRALYSPTVGYSFLMSPRAGAFRGGAALNALADERVSVHFKPPRVSATGYPVYRLARDLGRGARRPRPVAAMLASPPLHTALPTTSTWTSGPARAGLAGGRSTAARGRLGVSLIALVSVKWRTCSSLALAALGGDARGRPRGNEADGADGPGCHGVLPSSPSRGVDEALRPAAGRARVHARRAAAGGGRTFLRSYRHLVGEGNRCSRCSATRCASRRRLQRAAAHHAAQLPLPSGSCR